MPDRPLSPQEVSVLELEAQKLTLEIQKLARDEKFRLADGDVAGRFALTEDVGASSVRNLMREMASWSRRNPGAPVSLVINSGGGSVMEGLALYDFLLDLRNRGHALVTEAYGRVASMAGVLFQAGDVRLVGKHAFLMIHEVATMTAGKSSGIEDDVKLMQRLWDQLLDILSGRTTMKRATIKRNATRKDWWLSSDEVVKHGFADGVI